MSVSKAFISGIVVRNPEKRFTSNDIPVTNFAINIGEGEEEAIVRVITLGKLAEKAEKLISKGTNVIVDGRLQTNVVKDSKGDEKRIIEINAQALEVISGSASAETENASDEPLFSEEESVDDLIGEDEIPF